VEDDMRHRTILPKEQGVLYRNGGVQILWTFEDFRLAVADRQRVVDIIHGETFIAHGELAAVGQRIYRLENE
jgi:hypothetical protein